MATLTDIHDHDGIRSLNVRFPAGFCQDLQIGASVALDGVCLTVTSLPDTESATFDVILQSLHVTNLGELKPGSRVNAERAAREGAEIGGHPLSGHVDFCAVLTEVDQQQQNARLRFQVPEPWMRYIFAKGYIALNGTSLTVAEADRQQGWFEVWLIPETRRMTTFEDKQPGSRINIEIERNTQVMVDTVRDLLDERLKELLPGLEQWLATQPKADDGSKPGGSA
ncbi:MAG: riboflavin synthase subunit alpha [Thiolinea sp.]